MNFLLTNKCNNNCSFCFAQKNNKEIKFSTFKKIFNLYLALTDNSPKTIGLLGGEPTLHKDFFKILKYSVLNSDKINKLQLFTNCNYPANYNKKILKILKISKCEVNISCNLSVKNETSEKNLKYLLQNFENVCLSVTLHSNNLKDYEYILKYKKEYNLKYIRLAIANNNQLNFVKNQNLQNMIAFFIENKFNITWDSCGYFTPCMFKNYREVIPLLDKINFISKPCFMGNPPLDITPEGDVISCLGNKENKIHYKDFYFKMDLPQIYKKVKNTYVRIDKCKDCEFNSVCFGFCQMNKEKINDFNISK